MIEGDSPFMCPVCCHEYSSSEKHKKLRPYSYECGHTTCQGCIEQNRSREKKCPFCSKPSRQPIRNFSLEQALDWAKDKQGGSDETSLYKNQNLCLTCMETYDPSIKILFGVKHEGHDIMPLKDKDPKLMKKVFWLLSFIKRGGSLDVDRAEILLTMMFNIIDHFLESMVFVQGEMMHDPKSQLEGLVQDIHLFMKHESDPKRYQNKKLIDSLLAVRELEVDKSFKIFDLAKDCQISTSDLLDTEFFEDLKKDQTNYTPLGMPEKYLGGLFPLLSSLCPGSTLHDESPTPSQSWFKTWMAERLQISTY